MLGIYCLGRISWVDKGHLRGPGFWEDLQSITFYPTCFRPLEDLFSNLTLYWPQVFTSFICTSLSFSWVPCILFYLLQYPYITFLIDWRFTQAGWPQIPFSPNRIFISAMLELSISPNVFFYSEVINFLSWLHSSFTFQASTGSCKSHLRLVLNVIHSC